MDAKYDNVCQGTIIVDRMGYEYTILGVHDCDGFKYVAMQMRSTGACYAMGHGVFDLSGFKHKVPTYKVECRPPLAFERFLREGRVAIAPWDYHTPEAVIVEEL